MGLSIFLEALAKADLEISDERAVGAVEPDDRLVGAVVVVMPRHAGGGDEVARLHRKRLAVGGGLGPASADDEADRAHSVMMSLGDFSGLDELGAEEERVGGRHVE